MTPEYKAALKTKLEETDWSVLPDVKLKSYCLDNFIQYRKAIRDELLGNTNETWILSKIPSAPEEEWE